MSLYETYWFSFSNLVWSIFPIHVHVQSNGLRIWEERTKVFYSFWCLPGIIVFTTLTLWISEHIGIYLVGNKAKGQISKRLFQENNARKISEKWTFLPPDIHKYECISGGNKCSFFGKFSVLCFLETPVLRFTLLPYYRRSKG